MLNQRKSKFQKDILLIYCQYFRNTNEKTVTGENIFFFEKYRNDLDFIDEKTNDQPVGDSIDEEQDIKPDQTDDEIEGESLNKEPTVEQDDEEHPTARFVSFIKIRS